MNERIEELAKQAGIHLDYFGLGSCDDGGDPDIGMFAELIIRDTINALRQEWFDENNDKDETDKRETAIRLGKKLAYMNSVDVIIKRFGVAL